MHGEVKNWKKKNHMVVNRFSKMSLECAEAKTQRPHKNLSQSITTSTWNMVTENHDICWSVLACDSHENLRQNIESILFIMSVIFLGFCSSICLKRKIWLQTWPWSYRFLLDDKINLNFKAEATCTNRGEKYIWKPLFIHQEDISKHTVHNNTLNMDFMFSPLFL